jgi:hypothetical protein
MNPQELFVNACFYGNLQKAKGLLYVHPTIDISVEAFCKACGNAHLNVAFWILKIKPEFYISAETNEGFISAFLMACYYGWLNVVKWIYLMKHIDINHVEKAFVWACKNGHLEIAQWIYQVNPSINISAYENQAFRECCDKASYLYDNIYDDNAKCKYLKVAQWFQMLRPYLYKLYYDENGEWEECWHIASKEEARWEEKKYAVWLASNKSPNKDSILYKIPQDLSRQIIQSYV